MSRSFATLGVAVLVAFAATERAEAIDIQRVVSPGGIEAWLVEDDAIPVISVAFAFTGGASQDPVEREGVAKLASATMDEGASWLDSKAFQGRLSELSISLSYEAGRDVFRGSLRTLKENFDDAALLLRLSLNWPRFDAEPVERIRAQILSSISRNERDPHRVAGQALMRAAFPGHPYGRPVDGTAESMSAITVDDLRAFQEATLARDNLTVAVVGDIDAEATAAFLDQVFGPLPARAALAPVADTAPVAGERVDIDMPIPQTVIQAIGPGLLRDDPAYIDAFVAAYILGGGGFGSRLFDEIREERGLAYSVGLGIGAYDHAGIVSAGTSTRTDQAAEVVALLESEIARYATEGPTEEELEDAKRYLIGSYPLRFTTSRRIAEQLLGIQLDDLGIDYVDKRNDMIAALTVEDVREAAARLFAGNELTIVTVGRPDS